MKRRRKKKNTKTYYIAGAVLVLMLLMLLIFPWARSQNMFSGKNMLTPAKNAYKADAFYLQDGFLRYAEAEHMVGIDVSVHQGVIDWQAVADSGVAFAILRAGYRGSTIGELYEDERFAANLQEAKAAGIQVGVYFFSQALNETEAKEEAEFVCQLLNQAELELPVFYDWEFIGGRVPSEDVIPLTKCAIAFCQTVQAHGYNAGVYFNQTYGYDYFDLRALEKYTLWLAEYDETPDFAYHFDCLQYSDEGSVNGISGAVDLDIYFP